jgi:hypothetical protein
MRRAVRRLASAAVASTLLVGTAARAEGPTTSECVSLNENAGPLQKAGKLVEAHASLVRCSASTCPTLVRDDCVKGAMQVEAAIPTIVFEARDGAGNDRSEVRLSVDGKPRTDKLTGVGLEVDPGEHAFAFEAAGLPPLVKHYVIHAGEKNRREQIVLGPPAPSPPQPGSPEPASKGGGALRPAGLAIAGVGAGGLVVGGVFGLLARSKWNQAVADCGNGCAEGSSARSLGSTAHVDASVSNVGFAAGGGLAIVGLVLFLVAPHSSEAKSPPNPQALLTPFGGPGTLGLSATGTFP